MNQSHRSDSASQFSLAGDVCEITTTLPDEESVTRIAQQLLEQRLAACVQVIGPIQSHFRWNGALEQSREWKLFIKTNRQRLMELGALLTAIHPYEVPEILVLDSLSSGKAYADWVKSECI